MANSYTLSPAPFQKFFLANGEPAANGRVYTFLAGLTTAATTYRTSSGIPNSNPIQLDGAGQCTIFLAPGSYSYAIYAAPLIPGLDTSGGLIETQDNILAIGGNAVNLVINGIAGETINDGQVCYLSDGSAGKTAGRWYLAKSDNIYSSVSPEIGFCVGGVVVGASGVFLLSGQVTSGISVTVGLPYYISSTVFGDITSSPQSNSRQVGVADSGTSIVAYPNPPNPGIVSGTWTPVIGGSGGTAGQTYSQQSGSYIKIGTLVWASFTVALSAKGTITGNVIIGGFPFVATNPSTGIVEWINLATTWVNIVVGMQSGASSVLVVGATAASGGNSSNLATADIGNNTIFTGVIVYSTT